EGHCCSPGHPRGREAGRRAAAAGLAVRPDSRRPPWDEPEAVEQLEGGAASRVLRTDEAGAATWPREPDRQGATDRRDSGTGTRADPRGWHQQREARARLEPLHRHVLPASHARGDHLAYADVGRSRAERYDLTRIGAATPRAQIGRPSC